MLRRAVTLLVWVLAAGLAALPACGRDPGQGDAGVVQQVAVDEMVQQAGSDRQRAGQQAAVEDDSRRPPGRHEQG